MWALQMGLVQMTSQLNEGGPNGISPNDPFKSNTGGSRVPPWGVEIHSGRHQFIISSSSVCHQFIISSSSAHYQHNISKSSAHHHLIISLSIHHKFIIICGSVHILKPYTFKSEFRTIVHSLVF